MSIVTRVAAALQDLFDPVAQAVAALKLQIQSSGDLVARDDDRNAVPSSLAD